MRSCDFLKIPLFFFEQHFERLLLSAKGKNLCTNLKGESINLQIKQLLELTQEKEGNLKIVLHSESPESCDVYIYHVPHFYPSDDCYMNGVKIISLKESRPDPNLKNWRPDFRKKVFQLKKEFNAFEVLLINEQGIVTEGSQSNIFAIMDGRIITSKGAGVLKGITREYIFEICHEEQIQIEEKGFTLNDLKSAEAIFITGTSPKILPVSIIDNLSFSVKNSILRTLIKKYNHIINQYIKHNK